MASFGRRNNGNPLTLELSNDNISLLFSSSYADIVSGIKTAIRKGLAPGLGSTEAGLKGGSPGLIGAKSIFFGVDRGRGARSAPRSGDPVIGESGDRKTKNLPTDQHG
jgi:hypothetical protein